MAYFRVLDVGLDFRWYIFGFWISDVGFWIGFAMWDWILDFGFLILDLGF